MLSKSRKSHIRLTHAHNWVLCEAILIIQWSGRTICVLSCNSAVKINRNHTISIRERGIYTKGIQISLYTSCARVSLQWLS